MYPKPWQATKVTIAISTLIFTLTINVSAATEQVLHSFDLNDGGEVYSGLIFDGLGNLYGTTLEGGASGQGRGTVFKLSPASDGSWTETVLYSFTGGQDGRNPAANVTFDAQGALYGTTEFGGVNDSGTVFKLTPGSGGMWTEAILHSFAGGTDGANPVAGVVFDSVGNLYGTTPQGGNPFGLGTVFKLKLTAGGQWKEIIIHRFKGGSDGSTPEAGVIFDAAGNLYGTTAFGGFSECGGSGCGTVFRLKPTGTEKWTGQLIHRFKGGIGGGVPLGSLIFDKTGDLYGTTEAGGGSGCGGSGCGTVFKLSPLSGDLWAARLIYRFDGGRHGGRPFAGVVLDAGNNLYGTTLTGGTSGCGSMGCGTVFELQLSSGGKWRETVLHSFRPGQAGDKDGSGPEAAPILDSAGNVYGTTVSGGSSHFGTVFEITP